MAYFSDVRQLLRNGGLTSYLKIRMKMAEHTHTHTHTHARTHTHTHTGIYSSFYDASSIQIYTPGWREALWE